MLESGKRFSVDHTTYVQDVVAALVRTGHYGPAWLYVGLWGDYAQRVPYRSNEAWALALGTSRRQVQRWWQQLTLLGLVKVQGEESSRRVELPIRGELTLLEGVRHGDAGVRHTVAGVRPCVAPPSLDVENAVSPCYVSISGVGTDLALTTSCSTTASTAGKAGVLAGKTTTPPVGNSSVAAKTPKAVRPRGGRPKADKKPKGEGKKPKEPKGSHDFRRLAMADIEAREPERYAQILALHADWNAAMGTKYTMNPWAYAAWRLALVEAGYPEEKLRAAMPAVAADPWWRDRCSDPHKLFAKNPAKIEQFFPENRTTTPDRLGRGVTYRTDSFDF